MELSQVLKRPIVTEKSLARAAAFNEYSFEVERKARKEQIAEAVARQFKVKVEEVRTLSVSGKRVRSGKLRRGKKKVVYKKAIVRLKTGEKIDLFEER